MMSISYIQDFCRKNGVEVLAVQPPGRGMRIHEPFSESAQEMAQTLLPLLAPKLQDGTPYVMISHSMGCWIGYELLLCLRLNGLPLPLSWFLGAMPCPSIPFEARPWRLQHLLNDEQFKIECRGWDINDAVFQMWALFEPMLRADFHIFDSYKLQDPIPAPFDNLPIHAFWGTADKRVKKEMVQGWRAFTTAIEGNHLWPLNKEPKLRWLQLITDQLARLPIYTEA
ncbi:Alpha/Beta hydrolase protein [Dunaliella salina]|uniref:Alpha/Beta hydrolase protein n=1 Tax=Dunaliella salina TaxID=3046 RepID=A0ABQ7GLR6_DUNSA|nr:Alpha/Beta hydrolase protein [Dunaliella salina]|eukprot:KAF5835551.1 Alpha/Beta hydrolase protein [Dunaliella salina]